MAAVLVPVKARPGNDGACGQGRAAADLDRPCARRPQHVWVGAKKRDSESNKETGMKEVESGVKYMLDFKSPIQGLLGVHSHYGLHTRAVTVYRDTLSEGFSHFVTSIAAPVASGWSVCRGACTHLCEGPACQDVFSRSAFLLFLRFKRVRASAVLGH